jgi:hypothetical protein
MLARCNWPTWRWTSASSWGLILYVGLLGMTALGTKSMACWIHRIGDNPCGTSFTTSLTFTLVIKDTNGLAFFLLLSISLGGNGVNLILIPSLMNEYVLAYQSWWTWLSYCQGLPRRRWHASIGTTSHQTWSWYFRPMEKVMRQRFVTFTSLPSLSHCNFYEWGWLSVGNFNLSTM